MLRSVILVAVLCVAGIAATDSVVTSEHKGSAVCCVTSGLAKGIGYVVLALLGCKAVLMAWRRMRRQQLVPGCLNGKRVVITGASSGIGEALARMAASLGASVALAARREERLEQLAKDCRLIQAEALAAQGGVGAKPETIYVATDVTDDESVEHLMQQTESLLGGIDLLICNAGRGSDNAAFEVQAETEIHRELMDVNYHGVISCIKHALPALKASRKGGNITVISSLASLFPTSGRTSYAPTKAAVSSLTESLRLELKGVVAMTLICPGYVVSEIHEKLFARGVSRNMSKFMSAEEAARQILTAALNNDRQLIMTRMANLGWLMRPFMPFWFRDYLIEKNSRSAFKGWGDKSD